MKRAEDPQVGAVLLGLSAARRAAASRLLRALRERRPTLRVIALGTPLGAGR